METIWKYALDITGEQLVEMPEGAKIIHVGPQDDALCIWAAVKPGRDNGKRLILILGTGNDIWGCANTGNHLGSAVCGMFVWHVFDGGWR